MASVLRPAAIDLVRRGGAAEPVDSEQFEALFRQYGRRVRAMAWRRLGDAQEAEDAVQETFLHAYRALPSLDPRRPAWPWLSRIAANVCVDMLRLRQTHPENIHADLAVALRGAPDHGADPAERFAATEHRRHIAAALAAVCQRQRRVLMLREAEGWPYEDIAALEGITLDALKGAMKRARQSFREAYAASLEAGGGLAAVLSPRRAWRWLRLRSRVAIDRVQQAAGSLTAWSAMPLAGVSSFLAAATVTLAAIAVSGGVPRASTAGTRLTTVSPAASKRTPASPPVAVATPSGSGPAPRSVGVSAQVPGVAQLPPVSASATALRPHDAATSWGIAQVLADTPAGHLGQEAHVKVRCNYGPAEQAACEALNPVPG